MRASDRNHGQQLRAVAYPRVSSGKQKEANTVASQLSTLPQIVERRGWKLVRPVDHYLDDGKSAKTGRLRHRAGFQRMLTDAEAGVFDVVIIVGFDRLTRTEDFGELGEILGPLQRAGVQIADGDGEPLDLGTRTGRWMAMVKAMVAADENQARGERTYRGRRHAARKGWPPGKRPWGLLCPRRSTDWSIDEPRAEMVREMFKRIAAGESALAVDADMARRGVPGCPQVGRWYRGRTASIIRSTAYRGEWEAIQGHKIKVPQIVDDELWFAANAALTDSQRRGLDRTRHVYLIGGLAFCGECGSKIKVHSSPGRDGVYRRHYLCDRRLNRQLTGGCALPLHRVDQVDPRVWAALEKLVARPDLIAEAAQEQEAEAGDWRADLVKWEKRLGRLGEVEAGVLEQYRKGRVSDAALGNELERIARERRMLEQQMAVARGRALVGKTGAAALKVVAADLQQRALAALTPEEKRDMVRDVVPGRGVYRVTLRKDGKIEIVARVALGARGKAQEREVAVRVVA